MQDETPITQLDWLVQAAVPEQPASRLSAGFPERMVIFDCETTGGKATYHRITEVGLLLIDNGEIVEQWQRLVNPGMHIPPEIQRLTGITPGMLKEEPDFAGIADELLARLQGRVLVAHNARFDYGFLKNEFGRLDIPYSTKPLCSVKVSRRLFPQYKRHSLSEIIKRFDFSIENRHRALDDALMVWKLFLKSSEMFPEETIRAVCAQTLKRPALPMQLPASDIDKLPKSPGVYYFYDAQGKLLYIGKSVNIRERVMNHFTQDYRSSKDHEMSALIAHIDFEKTPSDFGAQIRESQQIKVLHPYYNRRLRKIMKLYQFEMEPDALGYLRVRIQTAEKVTDAAGSEQFGLFRSRKQAEGQLGKLVEHFFLCQKLCGLQMSGRGKMTPCFGFQLKRCFGACCGQESPEAYNERVHIALKEYRYKAWPWPDAILLEERGKGDEDDTGDTTVWHLLHEWRYIARITRQDELFDHGYQLAAGNDLGLQFDPGPDVEPAMEDIDFDLDIYLIMVRFLLSDELIRANRMRILPCVTHDPSLTN